jgi:hypothetical protein
MGRLEKKGHGWEDERRRGMDGKMREEGTWMGRWEKKGHGREDERRRVLAGKNEEGEKGHGWEE